MEPLTRITYLFKQYDNILGWYHQAESKGTLLHAINGVLVTAVNGLVFLKGGQAEMRHSPGMLALLALSAVCVVGSYLFMLKAVWARHHGREPPLMDKEKLWFFGHVASLPRETYKRLLDPFVEADIEATMLAQNHILARNVTTKFNALNWAISLTIAAIIAFFLMGLVYALEAEGGLASIKSKAG